MEEQNMEIENISKIEQTLSIIENEVSESVEKILSKEQD